MTAAVAARPHLIKPNHEELAELVGHPLPTLGDVHAAARDLVADGIEVVAVSLGGDGALLVTADELVHARATITAPLSTVGAGDCMLAGLLHGLSSGLSRRRRPRRRRHLGRRRRHPPRQPRAGPARPRRHPRRGHPYPRLIARPALTPKGSTMPLITDEQVVLDLTGADRHEATRALAERLVASGRCTDLDTFLADVSERESKMATGLPGGIGIPHARSAAITEPSLVFGRSTDGIDWGAKDGPATLVFLIAAPEGGGDAHMQMLPKLARALMKKDFKAALAAATTEAEVVAIVEARGRARPAQGPPPPRPPLPRPPRRRTAGAAPAAAAAPAARPRPPRLARPPPWTTARARSPSSASPPARPASRTPTWRPSPSRTPPRPPVTS